MQDTYELLSLALSLHVAFEAAKADGKVDLKDAPLLLGPMMKLPAAIGGVEKCVGELKAMDPAQRGELMAKLAEEYDIPNDKLEAKVEAGVEWLLATGKFVGVLTAKEEQPA